MKGLIGIHWDELEFIIWDKKELLGGTSVSCPGLDALQTPLSHTTPPS